MSDPDTRFKLTVHYDGSALHGWQVQPGGPTVQGEIERAAKRLAAGRRVVLGAGRTDAGVHACGQVAVVDMPPSWSAGALAKSLNALLPGAIWIERVEAVPGEFHPRYEAVSRTYAYRVGTAPQAASPFRRQWCWPLDRPFDRDLAALAAESLTGAHDFRAFAKAGQPHRGYRCRVEQAGWREWNGMGAIFDITANRFLHRMVRYLVGTMVDIGRGARPVSDMARLLNAEPGLRTSRPAPPSGLFLARVNYADDMRREDQGPATPAGAIGSPA